jgi:hypothetical protein
METVQTANPPSFESVWAAFQETDRLMKENAEQHERDMKEIREIQKATDRQIGKLGSRMGEVIEHMVAPNLREKFRELGYDFPQANPNSDVSDRANNIFLEIDVKLENGDKAMLVEVKTKPTTEDVQDHIKRLEKMRKYADLHGDKRKFLGAVAGVVITDNVKEYILKQGFFVIEPSGETFNIIPPNNKPKEW